MINAAATRLADARELLDGHGRRVVDQVADHGWRSTAVAGPPGYASYTYTTGFWLTLDMPEVVIFDLPTATAHDMFGLIARDVGRGRRLSVGAPVPDIIDGEHVCFVAIGRAQAQAFLPASHWFYRGAAFPSWQVIWGDASGRFPWDDGFDVGLAGVQPDLSPNGDWGGLRVS